MENNNHTDFTFHRTLISTLNRRSAISIINIFHLFFGFHEHKSVVILLYNQIYVEICYKKTRKIEISFIITNECNY